VSLSKKITGVEAEQTKKFTFSLARRRPPESTFEESAYA